MNRAAIFAKVVEMKGFAAAGRVLRMPKTTVSKRVADLEAEIGVRLLNRTTRRVSMTEAGVRAYGPIAAAVEQMAIAEREARESAVEPTGMLTVAAPGSISVPFILPVVTAFMQRYPAVRVTLLSVNQFVDLATGGIDVLVWADAAMPSGHQVSLVARAEIGLYASADYLARHGLPATPADLAGHDFVSFLPTVNGRRFAWLLRDGASEIVVVPEREPRLSSNDASAILAAVAAGAGIGGLPRQLVEATATGTALVPVLRGWSPPPIEVGALFRDGSGGSAKTRLFVDFASDWFARHFPHEAKRHDGT